MASVGAGNRASFRLTADGGPTATVDIGSIQIAAGIGNPIIRGAGRHSIMAGGNCINDAAGFGRLTLFGAQHG